MIKIIRDSTIRIKRVLYFVSLFMTIFFISSDLILHSEISPTLIRKSIVTICFMRNKKIKSEPNSHGGSNDLIKLYTFRELFIYSIIFF